MPKTFEQELKEAYERLGKNPYLNRELQRVHQQAIHDGQHAYAHVEIVRPQPWKSRVDIRV